MALKYKQDEVPLLNEVATQADEPAQVFKHVFKVLAACLLALIAKGVPL